MTIFSLIRRFRTNIMPILLKKRMTAIFLHPEEQFLYTALKNTKCPTLSEDFTASTRVYMDGRLSIFILNRKKNAILLTKDKNMLPFDYKHNYIVYLRKRVRT